MSTIRVGVLAGALFASTAEARFDKRTLEVPGDVVAVADADLNGDGRTDLAVSFTDARTRSARRGLAIFIQTEQGFAVRPTRIVSVPTGAICFSTYDVLPSPGAEILFLERGRVMAGEPLRELVRFESPVLLAPDPRELPIWPIVRRMPEPTIVAPTERGWDVFRRRGEAFAFVANIPLAPLFQYETRTERRRSFRGSFDFRMTVDLPEVWTVDQTGDGLTDLVFVQDDTLTTYPFRADGTVTATASVRRDLGLRGRRERLEDARLELQLGDVDADGIADVIATKMTGGLSNATTTSFLFRGERNGGFEPRPLQTFHESGYAAGVEFQDVDGAGRLDLVRPFSEITILAITRMLVASEIPFEVRVHRWSANRFRTEPSSRLDARYGLDFSVGSAFAGARPMLGVDFDGDSVRDAIVPDGKDQLLVFKGTRDGFEEDARFTLSAPASSFTRWVKADETGRALVVIPYIDDPKRSGEIVVFDWR